MEGLLHNLTHYFEKGGQDVHRIKGEGLGGVLLENFYKNLKLDKKGEEGGGYAPPLNPQIPPTHLTSHSVVSIPIESLSELKKDKKQTNWWPVLR